MCAQNKWKRHVHAYRLYSESETTGNRSGPEFLIPPDTLRVPVSTNRKVKIPESLRIVHTSSKKTWKLENRSFQRSFTLLRNGQRAIPDTKNYHQGVEGQPESSPVGLWNWPPRGPSFLIRSFLILIWSGIANLHNNGHDDVLLWKCLIFKTQKDPRSNVAWPFCWITGMW